MKYKIGDQIVIKSSKLHGRIDNIYSAKEYYSENKYSIRVYETNNDYLCYTENASNIEFDERTNFQVGDNIRSINKCCCFWMETKKPYIGKIVEINSEDVRNDYIRVEYTNKNNEWNSHWVGPYEIERTSPTFEKQKNKGENKMENENKSDFKFLISEKLKTMAELKLVQLGNSNHDKLIQTKKNSIKQFEKEILEEELVRSKDITLLKAKIAEFDSFLQQYKGAGKKK